MGIDYLNREYPVYSINVIINNEGRLALQLAKDQYYNRGETVVEKLPHNSVGGDKQVIIIDMCEEDILSRGVIMIKN